MRAAPIIAALALAACPLTGCDEPPAAGPKEADVRAALTQYFGVIGAGPLAESNPQNFRNARIVSLGRCEALGSDYMCSVTFERPRGAGRAKRYAWMSESADGWVVNILSATEKP